MTITTNWLLLLILQFSLMNCENKVVDKPNVIFILIDDIGIGDLECQENPWIKTPNINQIFKESARLTDFHVSPYCTPTRSAIMTGQYPINNGAWATFKGRASLSEDSKTIAQVFQDNGYATGMFGKWHLGNNYPSRPTDKGFDVAIHHSFGGISELTDYWGNDYFDDVYLKNNEEKQFEGFCTDIWFDETIAFIEANKDKPFFAYLPTNAAHAPLNVADNYTAPYKDLEGKKIPKAAFYGLISNLDENIGRLTAYLKKADLEENTILIFATDNGTAFGYKEALKLGYNHGYSGTKANMKEGGHRVPFYIKWPSSKLPIGKDIEVQSAHVDIFPTLTNLCELDYDQSIDLDGIDLSSFLFEKTTTSTDRMIFIHNRQDWRPPEPHNYSCLAKDKWRLIDGKRLYDLEADRAQKEDLALVYPEVVVSMLKENDAFIKKAKLKKAYREFPREIIGNSAQKTIKLTIQNAIGDDKPIYAQREVAEGLKNTNNKYAIEVAKAGRYQIICKRWPKEYDGKIKGLPNNGNKIPFEYKAISPDKVSISLFNRTYEKQIGNDDHEVIFELELQKGQTYLEANFIEKNAKYGVYYIYIQPLT